MLERLNLYGVSLRDTTSSKPSELLSSLHAHHCTHLGDTWQPLCGAGGSTDVIFSSSTQHSWRADPDFISGMILIYVK